MSVNTLYQKEIIIGRNYRKALQEIASMKNCGPSSGTSTIKGLDWAIMVSDHVLQHGHNQRRYFYQPGGKPEIK